MHYLLIGPDPQDENLSIWQVIKQEESAIGRTDGFEMNASIEADGYKEGMWFTCERSFVPGIIHRDGYYQLADMEKIIRQLSEGEALPEESGAPWLTKQHLRDLAILQDGIWHQVYSWYVDRTTRQFTSMGKWETSVAKQLLDAGMVEFIMSAEYEGLYRITDKGRAELQRMNQKG